MKIKAAISILLFFIMTTAMAQDNRDGLIRSSVYELEGQLSRSMEQKIIQFVGVENIWVAVHLEIATEDVKKQLDAKGQKKKSRVKYEELPGLNISFDGNVVVEDKEERLVLDGSKFAVDPTLLLSQSKSVMVTVYNKSKIDKKVERLIRSLIEDRMRALKVDVGVSFNYRKGSVLESADLEDGKKIRFDPNSFTKSVHQAITVSFKEFINEQVLGPLKVGFSAVIFFSLVAFGLIGYFLFRALSAINGSLGALLSAARNFEISSAHGMGDLPSVDQAADKTTTLQSDAVNLQQKILEIYTNYSEVVSSFFMNSMDKKEFKDVWALTQVLGDRILLENKNICRNENFHFYNKFLQNSMHLVTSAEDFKRIYQKLMSLMLYPEVFFLNSIKGQMNSFSLSSLLQHYPSFSEKEKLVAIEVLDDLKLATLVNKGLVRAEGLSKSESHRWNMEELKAIDKKLTMLASHKEDSSDLPLLNVMRYFSEAQFDGFIKDQNLRADYSFEALYQIGKEEIDQFLKGLSVEDLCALLPMLEEGMANTVYSLLPELKQARVRSMSKMVQERSFTLMAELYKKLWTEEFKQELSKRSGKAKSMPQVA